ncbi:TPA: hypothetical protein ACH3X1_009642 [Trebouxia sp. C0004]
MGSATHGQQHICSLVQTAKRPARPVSQPPWLCVTCRGVAYLASLPCLTHVRMAGCHRIKLYQESRESSGKVDIRQWADYDKPASQRKQWSCSFKKMLLCTCSSAEAD